MVEFLRIPVGGGVQVAGPAIGRLADSRKEVRVLLSNENQVVLSGGRQVPQDMQELARKILMDEQKLQSMAQGC